MADFQNNLPALHKVDATVVALSVDTREQALEIADLTGARYPMVYGLDAPEVGELIGAYVEPEHVFIHASSFILRPDGTVALAAYSSGQIPRLRANETAAYIQFLKKGEARASG